MEILLLLFMGLRFSLIFLFCKSDALRFKVTKNIGIKQLSYQRYQQGLNHEKSLVDTSLPVVTPTNLLTNISALPKRAFDASNSVEGIFGELESKMKEIAAGIQDDFENYVSEIQKMAAQEVSYQRENTTNLVRVFQNNVTEALTILQLNKTNLVITMQFKGIGSVTVFKDLVEDQMECILHNGTEAVTGAVKSINGLVEFYEGKISNAVESVLTGAVFVDAYNAVENYFTDLFKKKEPGRKGGDFTSFLGRCPGFAMRIWTPVNFIGGEIWYQGPLDNGHNYQDIELCFLDVQSAFKPGFNPLDYIWPQPRECITKTVGICECSLDTVPKIQYAFPDQRQTAYDAAVAELRDFTQGYLPRKGAAYGAFLTASYSCAMDPDEPNHEEFKLELIIDYTPFIKGLEINADEE